MTIVFEELLDLTDKYKFEDLKKCICFLKRG